MKGLSKVIFSFNQSAKLKTRFLKTKMASFSFLTVLVTFFTVLEAFTSHNCTGSLCSLLNATLNSTELQLLCSLETPCTNGTLELTSELDFTLFCNNTGSCSNQQVSLYNIPKVYIITNSETSHIINSSYTLLAIDQIFLYGL